MGRFSEKQLTIMTAVVAVVITGLFAALVVKDLGTIEEEKATIEQKQNEIQAAGVEVKKMPGRELDVIVFREIVKRDSAILPDESDINKFINVIGEFEKASGVVVTQVQGLANRDRSKSKDAIIEIPMKLKVIGSMDQFLKFVNYFENYDRFVSITGFTVGPSNDVGPGGEPLHSINLELMTCQYNPKGSAVTRVEIPNYERRIQDPAVQQRIKQAKVALIERYPLKPRIQRRDPMVDPREVEAAPEDPTEAPEARFKRENALLEKLVLEVSLLKDDVKVEEQLREERDYMRLPAVSKNIDRKMGEIELAISNVLTLRKVTIPEVKERFIGEVVQPYEKIKEQRDTPNVAIVVPRRQVEDLLGKMREQFDARNYKDVLTAFEGFQRMTEGRELAPDAQPLKAEVEQLAQTAQMIKRFEDEHLDIDGVVIDPVKTSFAIINGQILAEGEAVDTEGRVRIHKIRTDQIDFEYHGIVIVKHLRRK